MLVTRLVIRKRNAVRSDVISQHTGSIVARGDQNPEVALVPLA